MSVVIPCYRYGHLLPACLESVLSQDEVEVEVRIVDDASPDGSSQVARTLAAADSRVSVSAHTSNQGHIATYNEGLKWASGKYTVLLSADDLLTPGALGRAVRLLEAQPQVAFAYGYSRYFRDVPPGAGSLRTSSASWHVELGSAWLRRRCRDASNIISSPEVVVRTRAQQEVGEYSADLPHSGDLEMWMRLATVGEVGVVRGVDQALYRRHAGSMSRTTYVAVLADAEQRYAAFHRFFTGRGAALPEGSRLFEIVRRRIAADALWSAARCLSRAPDHDRSPVQAQALVDFALSVDPEGRSLLEHHAYLLARDGGLLTRRAHPLLLALGLRRRSREWWFWQARRRWTT